MSFVRFVLFAATHAILLVQSQSVSLCLYHYYNVRTLSQHEVQSLVHSALTVHMPNLQHPTPDTWTALSNTVSIAMVGVYERLLQSR